MTAQIIDYSYARPAPLSVALAGFQGVMRYLGTDNRCIFRPELEALHEAGLGVGLIYETTANRTLSGAAGGREDALYANHLADQIGAPLWVPIFGTAVDFQANDQQTAGPITDYAHAGNNIGRRPWDSYGQYSVTEYLVGQGVVKQGWQCCAWSPPGSGTGGMIQGRAVSQHACMYQKLGYVLNDSSDVNDVLKPVDWLWRADGQQPTEDEDVTPELAQKFDDLAAGTLTGLINASDLTAKKVVELLTNPTGGATPTTTLPDGTPVNLTEILIELRKADADLAAKLDTILAKLP